MRNPEGEINVVKIQQSTTPENIADLVNEGQKLFEAGDINEEGTEKLRQAIYASFKMTPPERKRVIREK